MANTHNRYGFYPVRVDAPVRYFPVAATQTLAEGDMCILDSSAYGAVAIALVDSAILLGPVARACASLAEGTMIPIYSDPETEFYGYADADASALVAGSEVDITGATGAMVIDVSESTTDVLMVRRLCADDTAASAGQKIVVTINKHALAQID